jgi:hypothetical protein
MESKEHPDIEAFINGTCNGLIDVMTGVAKEMPYQDRMGFFISNVLINFFGNMTMKLSDDATYKEYEKNVNVMKDALDFWFSAALKNKFDQLCGVKNLNERHN